MQIEKIPIILVLGTISLYLLIKGIRGLMQKSMRVPNPQADKIPASMDDLALDFLKKRIDADNKVPANFGDKRHMIEITGKDLFIRAGFYIMSGMITLIVLILYLSPSSFDRVYEFISTKLIK